MGDDIVLQPECYTRHAEIENHIKEGKFWRGVIITVAVAGSGILIGQYNMSIENNSKVTALTSKLTTMVEVNTKRLDFLENKVFYVKGEQGIQGIQGIQGEKGKNK